MATLEALPEASVPLTSTSGCFGARAGKKEVEDEGPAHGPPGRRSRVWTDTAVVAATAGPQVPHLGSYSQALLEPRWGPAALERAAGVRA